MSLKIISINVNGLKSYQEKGAFDELISTYDPDILCMQEVKCSEADVGFWTSDYHYQYIPFANSNHWKKGYAGVATLVKEKYKNNINHVYFPDFYPEYGLGRIVQVNFSFTPIKNGQITKYINFSLVNVYAMNSGNKESERINWDKNFTSHIADLLQDAPVIICGDMNVVPSELDYWSDYEDAIDSMPGLMQFEKDEHYRRMKLCNLKDSFRELHPETRAYSWYSYRGGARENNQGWRIDLFEVSEDLMPLVEDSQVFSKFEGSDHCPIGLSLKI
jgi:exodeoxyribonuclease-3